MIWKIYLGVAAVVAGFVFAWALYCTWLDKSDSQKVEEGQFFLALLVSAIIGLSWLPILVAAVIGTVYNWSRDGSQSTPTV